jgi:hypothetical protein
MSLLVRFSIWESAARNNMELSERMAVSGAESRTGLRRVGEADGVPPREEQS